jgi:hypothetical protein
VEIEAELKEKLKKNHLKYAERLNTLFSTGIGFTILGIINWIIPDPLPLVDELLFTIGGSLMAWKAWNDRKVKLPLLIDQNYRYGYDGVSPDVEADSILTLLFKSIRCKIDPKRTGEMIEGMDKIEIESLWMTRYLNLQDHLTSGEFNTTELEQLIKVIEKVPGLKKVVKREFKQKSRRSRLHLNSLKKEIIRKTGITSDAMEVYIEIYRIIENLNSNK